MALVYEDVKKEDWDLYNSFLPSKKANDSSIWIVDREKNIYFFRVGGEVRECIDVYFMSWNDTKIFIHTKSWSVVGNSIHMWIDRILIYKKLDSESKIVKEIVDTIKAALQIQFNNLIKFQKIVKPTFKEER